ncbi:hypothetical protein GDO78_006494 [Eleutherodactylus coqui]|uniref:Uncharacterized protein n=1 Tax=Eleutherodactylus coqui TaxID=57060 RepID=A0A8J6KFL6_ELECQ|nr:hypothetical protein GDO78_006494 [Eleutherodactylus coqui]
MQDGIHKMTGEAGVGTGLQLADGGHSCSIFASSHSETKSRITDKVVTRIPLVWCNYQLRVQSRGIRNRISVQLCQTSPLLPHLLESHPTNSSGGNLYFSVCLFILVWI